MSVPEPVEPAADPPGDLAEQLLDEIVEGVHPLLAEAFFCAALPHWYDLDLFTAIRDKDDERNEGLIPRLEKYSFILALPDTAEPTFRTRDTQRRILNEKWITQDLAAYLAAHQRAHGYWQNYPCNDANTNGTHSHDLNETIPKSNIDEVTHEQNQLYHHYFVDLADATSELGELFRSYYADRLLAAIERLLNMADEARDYMGLLQNPDSSDTGSGETSSGTVNAANGHSGTPNATGNSPIDPKDLARFDHLVDHLYARQAQLQGRWLESIAMFEALRNQPGLTPELVPFVARGYANSLKEMGLYVEATAEYKRAIHIFKRQAAQQSIQPDSQPDTQSNRYLSSHTGLKIEQALTMIYLGEAYVDFALSANVDPSGAMQSHGWWERVQQVYEFFTSLPLVAYLSVYIGRRVWHPSFWRVLDNLDWIIGRLFGKGADQYLRADKILDKYGNESQGVLANEKLAFLYLKMGDFAQARKLFVQLLEITPSPLSEYNQAVVRCGLAAAELALGEPGIARLNLNKSLPILRAYGDTQQAAEAQTLLAEALLALDRPTEAIEEFGQVLAHQTQTKNREKATSIYERLSELVRSGSLDTVDATSAQTLAGQVTERRYPVRFRSLTTIFTQRLLLILLTLIFVLMPMQSLQLESSTQIEPEINFRVPPLLLKAGAEFKPDLSVGVTALTVTDVSKTDALLRNSAWLVLAYLLLTTVMGMLAIFSTPMRRMQREMQAKTLDIDQNGLRFGSEEAKQAVPWQNVRQLVRSDMSMFTSRLRVDDSVSMLASTPGDNLGDQPDEGQSNDASTIEETLLTIRASTAWYTSLLDWLAGRLPEDASQRTFSYSWLRNWAGLLYGVGLLTFIALTIYMLLLKTRMIGDALLMTDLPILRYSLFDLYPYLYMMLFIPPMLWFVFRPLRIRSYLAPRSLIPWVVGGAGVLLFAVRLVTQFRPWLTVPDIYPAGIILFTVVGAAGTIWQAKSPINSQSIFPFWSRATAAIVALLITIVVGTYVTRDMISYHHLVNGHYYRDQEEAFMGRQIKPILSEAKDESNKYLNDAVDSYSKAREIARYQLPWVDQINVRTAKKIGYPNYDQTIWYAATKSLADIATKLGDALEEPERVEEPHALYVELFELAPVHDKAALNIAQALALANQGSQTAQEISIVQNNEFIYKNAIEKFTEAINDVEGVVDSDAAADAKDRAKKAVARYRLWRAVANHALSSSSSSSSANSGGDNIRGSVTDDYLQAIEDFSNELLEESLAVKAQIGLGWLQYEEQSELSLVDQNLEQAFGYFQKASSSSSGSVEALLGMGYVHYRQAEQAIAKFVALGKEEQEAAVGQDYLQNAKQKLGEAEQVWLDAKTYDPFEPSIPISLATLHWKLANPGINTDRLDRCAEYKHANELLSKAINPQIMHIQSGADVAFSYKTRAQTTWLLQSLKCPEVEKLAAIGNAIDDYSQAIDLDDENEFYWHMRARLTRSVVDLHLKDARETLQDQHAVQTKITPLIIESLQDMDAALTIDPQDDSELDYEPNEYLGPIIEQAFNNGYSLLLRDEITKSTTVYSSAITTTIKYKGHRKKVENAAQKLANRLATHPSAEGEQIQQALQRTLFVLDLEDPAIAFEEAFAHLQRGDETSAASTYQRALRLAIDVGDTSSVAAALTALHGMSGSAPDSMIDLFEQVLPQFHKIQKNKSSTDALNLGVINAAVGKAPASMFWYAEGIRRANTHGPTIDSQIEANRFSAIWQQNDVPFQTVLDDIPERISKQMLLHPELVDNGPYWNKWAWSIYFLGWNAFLQGDEEAAKNALDVGQPYAEQAAALGAARGDVVNTYYPEGAWSWYHFVRASEKKGVEDYDGALADYSLAAIFSRPKENRVAHAERAQAAFRAGLMALHTNNEPLAVTWYKQGLQYVEEYADKGNMQHQRAKAHLELEAAIAANPALKADGELILQTLTQPLENQSE